MGEVRHKNSKSFICGTVSRVPIPTYPYLRWKKRRVESIAFAICFRIKIYSISSSQSVQLMYTTLKVMQL